MMTSIKNMSIYLDRMQKSVIDKMFFTDKIFDPIENIIDFGWANGELIKAIQTRLQLAIFFVITIVIGLAIGLLTIISNGLNY